MASRSTKKKAAKKSTSSELGPVILPERPCIKQIKELQASLVAASAAGNSVVIDASQVEAVDAATLQLLVAFENSMRKRSTPIEWAQPSEAFRGMADLCDLGRHLNLASIANDIDDVEADDDLCPVF